MTLQNLLCPDLIFLREDLESKEEAIRFLLDKVIRKFRLESRRDEFEALIDERERLGGTTFPSKLCVPHARVPHFDDMIVAIAAPRHFFISDGFEVRLVVFLLTSEEKPTIYLNTLSSFAKLSMKKEVFERLLSCRRPVDFLRIVAAQNLNVKSEATLREVLQKATSVTFDTSIQRAVDLVLEDDAPFLVVVDTENRPIGSVSATEILRSALPDVLPPFDNLDFMNQPGWLDVWRPGTDAVSTVMKPLEVLKEDLPLSLAAVAFQKFAGPYAVLTAEGKLSGSVQAKDLLRKIAWE